MTTKPVLLAVDDEPSALAAIEHDVEREYGTDFRIVGAASGSEALATLKQHKLRNEAVALLLIDQRMPQMTGVEFLEQAMELYPDAKRVLLTASADGDVPISTIRKAVPDYYLHKPWDSREEQHYPILKDLLADWQVIYRPPSEGLRLIGHRWAANTYRVRDLLARNQVHYTWLDLDTSEEACRLFTALGSETPRLPVLLFPDGSWLADPTPIEAAEHFGLRTQAQLPFYDLIIVGAGLYYGAGMSEAPLYRDQDVYLLGGANAAGQAALYFSRYARSVRLLVRGSSLDESMSQYLIDQIASTPAINVLTSTRVVEVKGEANLETITITKTAIGETQVLPTTALFVFIGAVPQTDRLAGLVERDEHGYILSGLDVLHDGHRPAGWTLDRDPFPLETSVPGVFVAGDTRLHSMKRVASAVGEGAMSVQLVHAYLRGV